MGHKNTNYGIEEELRQLIEADERERQREIKADQKELADKPDQGSAQS